MSSEINNDNPNTQLNTAYSQYDFMQKFNILLVGVLKHDRKLPTF